MISAGVVYQKLPKAPFVAGNLCGCSSEFGLLSIPCLVLLPCLRGGPLLCSPGVPPMSSLQGGDLLGGRNVWSVRIVRHNKKCTASKPSMAVEAPSTCDCQVTDRWAPKDRQKNRQIFWKILFYNGVRSCQILAALSGAVWSWHATKMLCLRAVSRKTAQSLKTVKITVVLGRLGAPVPLTLHLSWSWRLKIEIGLGCKETEQKLNQKWRVSKTACIKTAFRSFRV